MARQVCHDTQVGSVCWESSVTEEGGPWLIALLQDSPALGVSHACVGLLVPPIQGCSLSSPVRSVPWDADLSSASPFVFVWAPPTAEPQMRT